MKTDFSEWLQNELNERKMKPAELARLSRKDQGVVTRILKRQRKPESDTLIAFAHALKLPIEVVFRAAGLLSQKTEADGWVEEMNYKLNRLDPKYRAIAEKIIDSLIEEDEHDIRPKAKPKAGLVRT